MFHTESFSYVLNMARENTHMNLSLKALTTANFDF